jgi:hypothetical protein
MAITQVPAVQTGGMTLLSTTTLSGISTAITGISQSYVSLLAIITNVNVNTATTLTIEPDSFSGSVNLTRIISGASVSSTGDLRTNANLPTATQTTDSYMYLLLPNYNTTDTGKLIDFWCSLNGSPIETLRGGFERVGAIDSLNFYTTNGTSTFTNGTVKLYGVK